MWTREEYRASRSYLERGETGDAQTEIGAMRKAVRGIWERIPDGYFNNFC